VAQKDLTRCSGQKRRVRRQSEGVPKLARKHHPTSTRKQAGGGAFKEISFANECSRIRRERRSTRVRLRRLPSGFLMPIVPPVRDWAVAGRAESGGGGFGKYSSFEDVFRPGDLFGRRRTCRPHRRGPISNTLSSSISSMRFAARIDDLRTPAGRLPDGNGAGGTGAQTCRSARGAVNRVGAADSLRPNLPRAAARPGLQQSCPVRNGRVEEVDRPA